MNLIVVAAIAAIGIVAGQRLQQRVIERGVEHCRIVRRASLDLYRCEFLAPRVLRAAAHRVEVERLAVHVAFAREIPARAFLIDVRDRTEHGHAAALGEIETQPRAGGDRLAFHRAARAGHAAVATERTEGLEWAIELEAEPGRVLAPAAKTVDALAPFDRAVANDRQRRAGDRMTFGRLIDVDENMAFLGIP